MRGFVLSILLMLGGAVQAASYVYVSNAEDGNIERTASQMPPAVLEDYKNAERLRGHYDQNKATREYTEKILDKHGRPEDMAWWSDEQEKEVRRLERG